MRKFINKIPPVWLSFIVPCYSSTLEPKEKLLLDIPSCWTFSNRWSLLLNFKHSATGSSGENQTAPDGLTAIFVRLSDPVASDHSFFMLVSSLLGNWGRFSCLSHVYETKKCCRWSLKHSALPLIHTKRFFDFCFVLFKANFLHFLTEFIRGKECWFPSCPLQLFKKVGN